MMRDTCFAKLHPGVNLGFFIGALGFSMVVTHPAYLIAGFIGAFSLCLSILGKKAVHRLLMLLPVFVVLSAINPLLNTRGAHILFHIFGRPYTWEALLYGMNIAGMFSVMMLWFSCYNAVMTEDKFSYLFGNLAPSLALLLTMVFRMIPGLMRKASQIIGARKCIGMGASENSSAKERVTDGMTTLSVLASWALEGSVVTADSMNSRGYGTCRRSCFHSYRFTGADITVSCILAVLCVICLAGMIAGSGNAVFTPVLSIAPVTGKNLPFIAAYTLFLLIPTFLNLKEELIWRISRSKI